MKQKSLPLPRRYAAALTKYLAQTTLADLSTALKLGRELVAAGLGTLELANIHGAAVHGLGSPARSPRAQAALSRRAELFFNEANAPIEATHAVARLTELQLGQLRKSLGQRTRALAHADLLLQQDGAKHKIMQHAFADSGRVHRQCLAESVQLQKQLRQLSHQVLADQEDERTKISRELQDEIVQTLVGINVRLLTLKQAARSNNDGIKKQIANAQRLVVKSAQSVQRLARELKPRAPAKRPKVARKNQKTGTPSTVRTRS